MVIQKGASEQLARRERVRLAFAAVALFITLSAATEGCRSRAPSPADQAQSIGSLDSLRNQVLQLVGEPLCENVSQCRSIAFGAKPCGGPWSYVAYSTQATDSAKLAPVVAEYNAREAQLNRELGKVSDCRFVSPPKLACVASRCSAEK